MNDLFGNGKIYLKSCIFKNYKVYKLLYNLVKIGVVDAEHLLLLKNRCLSHLYSQKNLSYFPHMVCLPQPIQLAAVVNCCIGKVIKQQWQTRQMLVAELRKTYCNLCYSVQ